MGDLVKLECRTDVIGALAAHFDHYCALGADPEWLISAVWLCAGEADYLATSFTKVLADGYIARPLAIERVDDFVSQIGSELPDIAVRLMARGSALELPEPQRPPRPDRLRSCPPGPYSTNVLIRVAARAVNTHQIACGLLFEFNDGRLLVGTDPGTQAMVLSQDEELIERYLAACEQVSAEEYLSRYA